MIELVNKKNSVNLDRATLKGADGGYYTPAVDAEGNLVWVPSKENMDAVDATNIKGPQGDSGVYVGTTAPNNEAKIWINPEGGASGPTGPVDLSNYYTKTETDAAIETAVAGIKIPEAPTKVSQLTNDSEYQTANQVAAAITSALGAIGVAEEGAY